MIKRIGIVLVLMLSIVSVSLAAEKKENAKEQEKPKLVEARQDEEMAKKIKEAEKTLNNTKWQVNFSQITQLEKKEKFTDTVSFKDGKVELASLISQGFPATSFTITIKGDDNSVIIWETMQASEKKGLAFLKGEIEEGRMRGVLSRHFDEKSVKDYSFYSTSKEVVQEVTPPPPAEPVPPVVQAEEKAKASPSPAKENKAKQ
jgi:hypothetical protein